MSVQSAHRLKQRAQPGINLTPMLDVLFILIFFFVLATNIKDRALEMAVHLPESSSAAPARQRPEPATVTIDVQGNIHFDGRTMPLEELHLHLDRLARRGVDEVVVRGDEGVGYGRVWEVMDRCKQAGIDAVVLEARPAPASVPQGSNPSS